MVGWAFYLSALIAVITSIMAISRSNAVHALLYLVVSILSISVIFYLMGAPFAAALEVVVYAGAIMIVFIFVIMMLGMGDKSIAKESLLVKPKFWILPTLLSLVLLCEVLLIIFVEDANDTEVLYLVNSKNVGFTLFSRYLIAVELASMLLLAALVSAFHIAEGVRLDSKEKNTGE